jgi:hypothetical protein
MASTKNRRVNRRRDRRKAKQSGFAREGKRNPRCGHGASGPVSGTCGQKKGSRRRKAPSGLVKIRGLSIRVGTGVIRLVLPPAPKEASDGK